MIDGFEAIYVVEDGCERRVGLEELSRAGLEEALPVRSFPSPLQIKTSAHLRPGTAAQHEVRNMIIGGSSQTCDA
ncbi:hypothetical protein [Actinomadura vinacea]|uniref:hypothetical protein n=1 Tax=Actinomadura vinacea TaxID=115336 RepID=UPI0031DBDB9E